ncbi:phage tail tape measure protein [Rhizorhabdus sp.]|uniref:phage tail tape measure protein n=1 Tax=Rhizorhabdus sp. TaxID=1968843 RepID=UPI0035B2BFF3
MSSSIIGQLRVILGLDTAAFLKGASEAQKEMTKLGRDLGKIGDKIGDIGKSMSVGLTAPLAAAGAGIVKFAGDFEAKMNDVSISTQASGAQMKAMSELALDLGKSTVFSASEAAGAMDMLAKNGLTAQQILGGAAKAAIDLAAAAGTELDPAAAALTDTMAQFKMQVSDLPGVVNLITGSVNQSKFDFNDFQLAMAQAGGVAGKVGVNFRDFTTTLAAISSSFSSGSDAGTSFKAMLMAIGSPSSTAAGVIQDMGLKFYQANGQMRSMAEIAQELQDKFAGLSDQDRIQKMGDLFGADGIRAALSLMQQGAQGLDTLAASIAKTDAAAQSAQRMKGFNAQMEQLGGALETLAIKIGESGLLAMVTSLVSGLSGLVDKMSELDPALLNIIVTVGAVVAAIGPLVAIVGSVVSGFGTVIAVVARLGPIFTTLVPIIATIGRALLGLAIAGGPLTLIAAAAAAVYVAWQNWDKIGPILKRLYEGVKQWIGEKLSALFDAVKAKIKAVGDAFYVLWDRVVGHSYVPDMVDAIGQHFGRLDQNMVDPAEDATARTAEAFGNMAQSVVSDFQGMLSAIKRGDFGGAIVGLTGLFGTFGKIFGGGTTSADDFLASTLGTGGGDMPGFKTGGSFKVGGMSGIDRNLVQFRATRGEIVDIRKPGQDMGGGAIHNYFEGNLMTPEFWDRINSGDMVAAQRGAAGGSAMAQADLRRRGRQRLGRG